MQTKSQIDFLEKKREIELYCGVTIDYVKNNASNLDNTDCLLDLMLSMQELVKFRYVNVRFVTIEDASELCNISIDTLTKLIEDRYLGLHEIDGKDFLDLQEIDSYLIGKRRLVTPKVNSVLEEIERIAQKK